MILIRFFVFLLLLAGLNSQAAVTFPAPYLNQSLHTDLWFFDGWTGSKLESEYVSFSDQFRLRYCRLDYSYASGATTKKCQSVLSHHVRWSDLNARHAELVQALSQYRDHLIKEKDSHFFSRVLGGSKQDSTVMALDDFLAALSQEPLGYFVLMGPSRPERSATFSREKLEEIVQVIQQVLNRPSAKEEPAIAFGQ